MPAARPAAEDESATIQMQAAPPSAQPDDVPRDEGGNVVTEVPPPVTEQEAESIAEAKSEDMREVRDVPIEAIPDEQLPPDAQALEQAESDEARERRREVEDVLNKPIEAIEDAVNRFDVENRPEVERAEAEAYQHRLSNQTVLFGRTLPYSVYTVVFGVLAVVTLVEVLIAELLPKSFFLTVPLLIVLSGFKAVLVVLFYMHLREDSRLFAVALILPIIVAAISVLFLTAVPASGY
jgi:caa(3)-type oxidase subunit IV